MESWLVMLVKGLCAVTALLAVWEFVRYWRDKPGREAARELVRAAKRMDIGEGVTLQEGVRAYFGKTDVWGVPNDEGAVPLMAGLGDLRAGIFVYPETGRIEVLNFKRMGSWADETERAALIGHMVKAAKGGGARPRP